MYEGSETTEKGTSGLEPGLFTIPKNDERVPKSSVSKFQYQKRRDKLYIIAEILEIAKEGTLKTQIMYRANLSFTQLNDYLKFMLRINLLDKTTNNDKDRYETTGKGSDFLRIYGEITELLKNGDENLKDRSYSVKKR
jgi:predicted transcriptional regulator